jgi:DNA-directed RNA polymerase beta subunit
MIQIFVSYSHKDKQFLQKGELIHYLKKNLKGKAKFWIDEQIPAGKRWDENIPEQILNSKIAILLVSKNFIKSGYSQNVEVESFFTATIKKFVVVPVIISPCDPKKIKWISKAKIQYQPSDGMSVQTDYPPGKKRKAFYKKILTDLKKDITWMKKPEISAGQSLAGMINILNAIESDLLDACNLGDMKGNKHKVMFDGLSTELISDQKEIYGRPLLKVIKFEELKKLLKGAPWKKIKQLNKLLTLKYSKWFTLHAEMSHLNSDKKNNSIRKKKFAVIFEMLAALFELLKYLRDIGFDLDDHYGKIYNVIGVKNTKITESS